MILVRISNTTWVKVTSIEWITHYVATGTANVRMTDGATHPIEREENFSLAETVQRLVEKINHSRETMRGHSQD